MTAMPTLRDQVRLMVSREGRLSHGRFLELAEALEPGDLLVANDSATLPASLTAEGPEGAFPLHYSGRLEDGSWLVEPRQRLEGGGTAQTVWSGGLVLLPELSPLPLLPWDGSRRLWRMSVDADPVAYLQRHGRPIRYAHSRPDTPLSAYQSYFAAVPGSSEMPSAGRPFSDRVLDALRRRGVKVATLTLHTGVSSQESHELPYPEWFSVPVATRAAIGRARRVIAVGTTVLRALETGTEGGWTRHVVRPDNFRGSVDGLVTGLHEPGSTHRWMLQSMLSDEQLAAAYEEAEGRGYAGHEFGDMHLILRGRAETGIRPGYEERSDSPRGGVTA